MSSMACRTTLHQQLGVLLCLGVFSIFNGCGGTSSVSEKDADTKKDTPAYVDPGKAPEGQSEPVTDTTTSTPSEQKTNNIEPAESTQPITINTISWDGLQEEIKKHTGKVVVVDMWAFTCLACKKEFPHLVELQKVQDDKVVCISVSCDYVGLEGKDVDSYKPNALKFLTEKKAEFSNYILSDPQPELFAKITLSALPAVYVFKKDGTLAKRFDHDQPEYANTGFTYHDHINPLVNKILAE